MKDIELELRKKLDRIVKEKENKRRIYLLKENEKTIGRCFKENLMGKNTFTLIKILGVNKKFPYQLSVDMLYVGIYKRSLHVSREKLHNRFIDFSRVQLISNSEYERYAKMVEKSLKTFDL